MIFRGRSVIPAHFPGAKMENVINGSSAIIDKILSYGCVRCILVDQGMIVCHEMEDWTDEFFDLMAELIIAGAPYRANVKFAFWD